MNPANPKDLRIARRYKAGDSLNQIAKDEKMSRESVKNRLKCMGVQQRTVGGGQVSPHNELRDRLLVAQYLAGESMETLAASFRLTHSGVQSVLNRREVPIRKMGGIPREARGLAPIPMHQRPEVYASKELAKRMWAYGAKNGGLPGMPADLCRELLARAA